MRQAGTIAGLIALGVGAGIAAQKIVIRSLRSRPDPYEGIPYGSDISPRATYLETSDGAKLAVYETGPEGSRGLVYLHGYALDSSMWHHQADPFGYRSIFYDARHHGASTDAPLEAVDMRRLATDLREVIDHSGLDEVVLVGHSMGGMTILEFARSFPEELGGRVKGLVVANANHTDSLTSIFASKLIKGLDDGIGLDRAFDDTSTMKLLRLRGDDLSWLLVRFFGFGSNPSPTQVEFIRGVLQRFPTEGMLSVLPALRGHDVTGSLRGISVPTLVVTGEVDRIAVAGESRFIASEIGGSSLEVFPRAGHIVPLERAEEFNELLESFLSGILGGRGSSA